MAVKTVDEIMFYTITNLQGSQTEYTISLQN